MPSDKKFKDMNQEEKFVCLLEAQISDAQYIMRMSIGEENHERFNRYNGQLFAYNEALKFFKSMKDGKLWITTYSKL